MSITKNIIDVSLSNEHELGKKQRWGCELVTKCMATIFFKSNALILLGEFCALPQWNSSQGRSFLNVL